MKLIYKNISNFSNSALAQICRSVYTRSGAVISISQNITHLDSLKSSIALYPNFYMHDNISKNVNYQQILHVISSSPDIADKTEEVKALLSQIIFRVIISANTGSEEISLNINRLKKNPMLAELIKLHDNGKYEHKTSRIIIDDDIHQEALTEQLTRNILEIEKLIQIGLGLPVAFMHSKNNYLTKNWLEAVKKKCKAINSNIVEGVENPNHRLQEFVHSHGYRLEHLFLSAYDKSGQPISKLQSNVGYNINEIVNILGMVSFAGKIILDDGEQFAENTLFLESVLKKNGFQKKSSSDGGDGNFIAMYI